MESKDRPATFGFALDMPQYWLVVYGEVPEITQFQCGEYKKSSSSLYTHEAWLGPQSHINRFTRDRATIVEILTPHRELLPRTGRLAAVPCNSEHDLTRSVDKRVKYITTVETEIVDEHAYSCTLRELKDHAVREKDALLFAWRDTASSLENTSLLCIQFLAREVHTQAWHLDAQCGYVIRSQAIFELI